MRDQGSKRWFCLEEMKKKIEGKGGRKWHVKCRAVLRHLSNIKVSVGRGGKRPIRFKCVSLGGDEDKTAGGVLKDPKYLIKGLMMLYEGSE